MWPFRKKNRNSDVAGDAHRRDSRNEHQRKATETKNEIIERRLFLQEIVANHRNKKLLLEIDKVFGKRSERLRAIAISAHRKGQNKYGDFRESYLRRESEDFLDEFFPSERFNSAAQDAVEKKFKELLSSFAVSEDDYPDNSLDFERWCAGEIQKQGWDCQVTEASGDQGVDVIAMCDGVRVAIQCKRYSKPVGNKAIQEVFSGKEYSRADAACVISTAGFTASAQLLASATGVELLDVNRLGEFTKIFQSRGG